MSMDPERFDWLMQKFGWEAGPAFFEKYQTDAWFHNVVDVLLYQRGAVLQAVADAQVAAAQWDDSEGGTNHLVGGLLGILGCDDLVATGATRMPGKHRGIPT